MTKHEFCAKEKLTAHLNLLLLHFLLRLVGFLCLSPIQGMFYVPVLLYQRREKDFLLCLHFLASVCVFVFFLCFLLLVEKQLKQKKKEKERMMMKKTKT